MIVLALRAPALIVVTDPASSMTGLGNLLNWLGTIGLAAWGVLILFSAGAAVRRWAGAINRPARTAIQASPR